jgi:hypothetical protein
MSYANVHWYRGLADGCKDFDEVVEKLERQKERALKLKEIGCKIKCSHDDYIVVSIPESAVENYCGVIDVTPDELFTISDYYTLAKILDPISRVRCVERAALLVLYDNLTGKAARSTGWFKNFCRDVIVHFIGPYRISEAIIMA